MAAFDAPDKYVYVYFEDNYKENVGVSDALSEEDAKQYKKEWNNFHNHGSIVAVVLADQDGEIEKSYKF